MNRTVVISAYSRPHVEPSVGECWCNPEVCDCCGGIAHRVVDLRPSETPKMAVFSEQIPCNDMDLG